MTVRARLKIKAPGWQEIGPSRRATFSCPTRLVRLNSVVRKSLALVAVRRASKRRVHCPALLRPPVPAATNSRVVLLRDTATNDNGPLGSRLYSLWTTEHQPPDQRRE